MPRSAGLQTVNGLTEQVQNGSKLQIYLNGSARARRLLAISSNVLEKEKFLFTLEKLFMAQALACLKKIL